MCFFVQYIRGGMPMIRALLRFDAAFYPCPSGLFSIFQWGHLEYFMMTSSNGNIFRVTGPLCGEFTGPGEFPTQRPVTRSFDVFFDLRLNKRLSKQPWGWWFETLSWSLWRQCNVAWNGDMDSPRALMWPNQNETKQNCVHIWWDLLYLCSDRLSPCTWWRHEMETLSAWLELHR